MKWTFGFLGILIATLGAAQSNTEKEQILLSKLKLDISHHEIVFYRETTLGNFFTIKRYEPIYAVLNDQPFTDCVSRTYDTYLQVGETIFQIESLKGYRAFDFSSEQGVLIVGRYDQNSLTDSGIEELFKFDPSTKMLTSLGMYSGGVYGVEIKREKMFLLLNVKNVEGIGSRLQYIPFPIN